MRVALCHLPHVLPKSRIARLFLLWTFQIYDDFLAFRFMDRFQWDPLDLSDQVPVEWLRKSELSHGRSAMLATVGWVFPSLVGTFQGPVSTTDPIKAHLEADNQWWAQFILLAGVIEGVKYRAEMEGKSYTGEIGKEAAIDWTGQWAKLSDAEKETMATKELKNGRLAMMGMAGFICNYFFPGTVPGADIL